MAFDNRIISLPPLRHYTLFEHEGGEPLEQHEIEPGYIGIARLIINAECAHNHSADYNVDVLNIWQPAIPPLFRRPNKSIKKVILRALDQNGLPVAGIQPLVTDVRPDGSLFRPRYDLCDRAWKEEEQGMLLKQNYDFTSETLPELITAN
jgi:hypothetical protein